MANDSEGSKSMDVQKPSDVKPDSSSRPIIVSNRAVMKDPMVVKDQEKPDEENADTTAQTTPEISNKKVIQPSSPATKTDDAAEEEKPAEDTPSKPTAAEDADEKDSAIVDAVVGSATKDKDNQQSQDLEDEKRKQNARVLAESKKYVVPVGQVSKAKHNRSMLIVLILIVLVTAGYLLVDVGLVTIPYELPYKIFNNVF